MLRERQRERVEKMLQLGGGCFWKLLIMDVHGQKILSPLFKVNDLRKLGVTVYMMLHSEREAVADVPAVYFVLPTKENIRRIVQDIRKEIYDMFYVFFIGKTEKERLFFFADECARNAVDSKRIEKICSVFLGFSSLEDNLFSLEMPGLFAGFGKSDEEVLEETVNTISDTLGAVLSLLLAKHVSVRCQENTHAELIARRLDAALQKREQEGEVPSEGTNIHVHLIDRSFDLVTPLQHSTEYNSVVHDILEIQNNSIRYTKDGKKSQFEIDADDWFWQKHSGSQFSDAIEDIGREFSLYREEEARVTGGRDLDSGNGTDSFKQAIDGLPVLLEKKRIISGHLSISELVVREMEARAWDRILKAEREIGSNNIYDVLKECNSEEDKLRLAILYLFSSCSLERFGEIQEIVGSRPALEHAKKIVSLLQTREESGLFRTFVSSVKTFIPGKTALPCIRRAVEIEKSVPSGVLTFGAHRPRPDIVFVFILGGATYSEWNEIKKCDGKTTKWVLGTTEMLNGKKFVELLEET
eukprot:GHVN01033530.1.p1 GENE.GHVN01033530.1~~GHVN01033530.1.p1  ORF type:complete len:527 (-),score=70.16 GHVN01033530.1:2314-3894(-)